MDNGVRNVNHKGKQLQSIHVVNYAAIAAGQVHHYKGSEATMLNFKVHMTFICLVLVMVLCRW